MDRRIMSMYSWWCNFHKFVLNYTLSHQFIMCHKASYYKSKCLLSLYQHIYNLIISLSTNQSFITCDKLITYAEKRTFSSGSPWCMSSSSANLWNMSGWVWSSTARLSGHSRTSNWTPRTSGQCKLYYVSHIMI